MRHAARTALMLAAVTLLSLAGAEAQAPGPNGPAASPPSTPEPASPPKAGEGSGARTEAGETSKPAETAPSAAESPAPPPDSDRQSVTLEALMREGFEVRATSFIPAEAVTRQSGKVSSDAVVMTLQKDAASAVCFYTLKAYVSKKLGTIPACAVHH